MAGIIETWGQFPTLHPLVVHVPVVLLPLAPVILAAGWGAKNEALERTGFFLLAAGWIGAVLAARAFHPHAGEMPLLAQEVLETHEYWADWTQGLGAAAVLAGLLAAFRQAAPFRRLLKASALLLSIAAAVAVVLSGHGGAVLTHIHNVEIEAE